MRARLSGAPAHLVHGLGDDRQRHELDGAVKQQEDDDNAAQHTAGPACGIRDRQGLSAVGMVGSVGLVMCCQDESPIESDNAPQNFPLVMPGLDAGLVCYRCIHLDFKKMKRKKEDVDGGPGETEAIWP